MVLPAGKDLKAKTGILAALLPLGLFLIWLVAGFATAAELVYPIENGASRFSRYVVYPLKEALARPRLVTESRRLADEVAALRMRQLDYDALVNENARLREALDFQKRRPGVWIAAPVLGKDGALGVKRVIRLGKGSLAGVRTGAAVAAPGGLVGRVSEVSPHTAEVRLISDPEIKVACEVETSVSGAAAFGILSGSRMMHLARDLVFNPRAKITTSGLGGVYPRGLTVGFLVNGAHGDESELEQEGVVVPAVDFSSLEDVFIHREE